MSGSLLRFAGAASLAIGMAGCGAVTGRQVHSIGRDAPIEHVVRASQYAFTTDFELDRNDPVVVDLLDLRAAILRELELGWSRQTVRVVIFENEQRYVEFFRRSYPELPHRRAFFLQHGDELSVFACRSDRLSRDLRHETTHAILHSVIKDVPLWLDEGLAEYYENGAPAHGQNAAHIERLVEEAGPPDLRHLESISQFDQLSSADYRASWFWVHFCLNHGARTRRIVLDHLAALRRGEQASLADRLERSMPSWQTRASDHFAALRRP